MRHVAEHGEDDQAWCAALGGEGEGGGACVRGTEAARPARKEVPQLITGTSHASRTKLWSCRLYEAKAGRVPHPMPVE